MEFEEILIRAKQGEQTAIQQIIETYRPMLIHNSRSSLSYTKLLISILLIGMCLSPPCPNRQAEKSLSLFIRLQEK